MHLVVGSRTYDLDTRALVVGVGAGGGPGADLVEGDPGGFATASDDAGLDRALQDAACLVRLPAPTVAQLQRCAGAGPAVVVPESAAADAAAAGLPAERIVPDRLMLDVADDPCPLPAIAAGVVSGARMVRTGHGQVARRVCDVLAAIWQAGQ